MSLQRRILAIDSSTELCSVCFTDGDRWIERRDDAGQRHSAMILALVRAVLVDAGCVPADLDEVTFGAGPGSFTGLRIACGVAQGIAYGAGIPVRAVSGLMAIAQGSGSDAVIAALDARMSEVYWAAYRRDSGRDSDRWVDAAPSARWTEVVPPTASLPQSLTIPPGDWCGAGNAFARFSSLVAALPAAARIEPAVEVTARSLAELALAGHGVLDLAARALPAYVRDKVAMTTAERAAR